MSSPCQEVMVARARHQLGGGGRALVGDAQVHGAGTAPTAWFGRALRVENSSAALFCSWGELHD